MKRLLSLAAALLTVFAVSAADEPKIGMAGGPYLQAVGETEFTVVWATDADAVAWVEIAPDDGTHFYSCSRPKYYQTHLGIRNVGKLHAVRVTGLEPATTYRYRILYQGVAGVEKKNRLRYTSPRGSDVFRHRPYRATTLDRNKDTVRFAMANDMHEHDTELRALFKDARTAGYDFVCFNGDMTSSTPDRQHIFRHYMSSASELFATDTPLYVARGNHELRGNCAAEFPEYFPAREGVPYYSFRQGPVFFIVLDGGEDKPDDDIEYSGLAQYDAYRTEEAEWLKRTVESDDCRTAPIKIAICHVPPSLKGWHGSVEISQKFVPLLNEAGIDLMLSGHIHRYRLQPAGTEGRTFPVLCNPSRCRLDATVTADGIDIRITDVEGKTLHTYKTGK